MALLGAGVRRGTAAGPRPAAPPCACRRPTSPAALRDGEPPRTHLAALAQRLGWPARFGFRHAPCRSYPAQPFSCSGGHLQRSRRSFCPSGAAREDETVSVPAAESGRGGDGKTLSKRIAEAGTPWAVADLVLQDPSVLSAGSIVAALVRMLKLRGASSSDGLPKPSPSLSRAMEVLALSTEELCPAMTPLQLSVVARAFALLSCTDQGLWAALTAEVRQCSLSHFTPHSLADLLWAWGHIGHMPGRQLLDVIALELTSRGTMSDRRTYFTECYVVSSSSSKSAAQPPDQEASADPDRGTAEGEERGDEEEEGVEPRRAHLRGPAGTPLGGFNSRELCMVLCAYAKMDHPPGPLLTGVSEQLLTDGRVASMAGQELSMLLWACAKLGERPGPLLDLIASELHARMQQDLRASWSVSGSAPDEDRETGGRVTVTALLFGVRRAWVVPPAPAQQYAEASRILSNVSWAYGKLSYHPGGLLHAAAACSTPLLGSMPPKDIARLVWGFARLGYGPSSFLSATARELRPERLSTFRPIQMSILLWSLAVLDHDLDPGMLEGVAEYIKRQVAGFSAQGLSNSAWALTRFKAVPHGLLTLLAEEAEQRIADFTPQGVAELVSACAAAGEAPVSFLESVSEHVVLNIEAFAVEDVLTILITFSDLGFRSEEMLEAVELWTERRLNRLSPQGLSMTLWAFAYTGYRKPALLSTAVQACASLVEEFSAQQLARILWSFGKLEFHPGLLLDGFALRSEMSVREFAPKELANILWAYGKLQHHPGNLMAVAADWAAPRLHTFSPQALANVAWSYARLGVPDQRFLGAIAVTSAATMSSFEPQGLSMLIYAFAVLGHRDDELLRSVAAEIMVKDLREFEPQNFANIIWGYGRLGFDPGRPLDCIASEVEERLPAFSSQELFNIVWGFAKLRRSPEGGLLSSLGTEAARRAEEFTAQELGNTAWAYARLGHHHHTLFDSLLAASAPKLGSFELQHLVNLLWALAQTGHDARWILPQPRPFHQLMGELESRIGDMRPQHLAMCLRSLAQMSCHPGTDFLAAAQRQAVGWSRRFRRFEICGLLWAFASCGARPEELLGLLQPGKPWAAALRRKDRVGTGEMVRGLWALALMRQHDTPASRWLIGRLADPSWAGRDGATPEVEGLRHQAFLLLEADGMGSKLPSWRDCATGNAPEQGGRKGLAALEKLLGELGRGQPQRLQAGDSPAGWLLTASDGSEEAVMVHLVAREDLMWYKPQTGEEEGTLQLSGRAFAEQRLLLAACPSPPRSVTVLVDDDWREAVRRGAEAQRDLAEAALGSSLRTGQMPREPPRGGAGPRMEPRLRWWAGSLARIG